MLSKFILISVVIIFIVSLPVMADSSLWSEEAADIYQDVKTEYQIGDVVTVIIEEDASAIQSADTNTSQSSEVDAGSGFGFLQFIKSFGFDFSDSGSAEGQTSRSGTLEADISTQITEISDTGNIRITGNKTIKINGEEQVIKLSGVIRPQDINDNNSVLSEKIADASIEYQGQGPVSEKQDPGLLSKLFNWIF